MHLMIKQTCDYFNFPSAPPVLIRRPPPYVYADKGTTVNLCCKADGSLVWSSSPTALTSIPSSQQNGCLSLSNMTRESAGKYTCRATNQFGFAEATTEVFFTGYFRILFFLINMYSERNIFASTVPGAGWEEGTGISQRLRDVNNRKWSKVNDSQKKEEEKEKKKMDQIFSPNNPHAYTL